MGVQMKVPRWLYCKATLNQCFQRNWFYSTTMPNILLQLQKEKAEITKIVVYVQRENVFFVRKYTRKQDI